MSAKSNQKMTKGLVVHLRMYKRRSGQIDVSFDRNGKAQNENHLMKLRYGLLEWSNFIKRAKAMGMVEIEVETVLVPSPSDKSGYKQHKGKEVELIKEQVKQATHGAEVEIELSPDQKEIAELKSQVEKLVEINKGVLDSKELGDAEKKVNELAEAKAAKQKAEEEKKPKQH